jgi:hypothetical protein
MKLFATVFMTVTLVILLCGIAAAQDTGPGETPLRPDLPLEKPIPETAEDPPEEQEPPEQTPPGEEVPPEEPPAEEEPPANPPPEFFEEPIEVAEVIFVIDRTGSMRWPSKMSIVDEGGNPINNATKYDVARIELIKAINNLAENMKFALVCYATGGCTGSTGDPYWANGGGGQISGRWTQWPPKNGQPAPIGSHRNDRSNVPVWPTSKTLIKATADNKAAEVAWSQQRLSNWEVSGGTCTYEGMSAGLKMVTPPPPGTGPGGEPKKSATGIYLLTDGAPTHIGTVAYALCRVYGSYDAGQVANDGTWTQQCMDLSKTKILAENVYNARIYTLGMGMDMSHPNAHVWNPGKMDWDIFATEYNDKCRKFLTELAEATGGHYREVSR